MNSNSYNKFWTKEQEDFLLNNWDNKTRKFLCKFLNKNIHDLYKKACELNISIDKKFAKSARSNRWTEQEINYLIENYFLDSAENISKVLKRSRSSVIEKAHFLKLKKEFKWTKEEEKILIDNFSFSNKKQILELLPNRTYNAIKIRSQHLKLKRIHGSVWSQEEILKLKELIDKGFDNFEISSVMKRSIISIKSRRRRLYGTSNFWTEDEINILYKYYSCTHYKKLMEMIPNRTRRSIRVKAKQLGIEKNSSLLWSPKEIELLINLYPNKTINELVEIFPDKEKRQIKHKAKKLKLRKSEEVLSKIFTKKIKYFSHNGVWRKRILRRDNFCCKECGFKDETGLKLQAHHIIPVRDDKCEKYSVKNGICLCLDCHVKIKNKEYEMADKFLALIGETK